MSDFLTDLITIVLIAIIIPAAFSFFIFFRKREERRVKSDENFKIKTTKSLIAFFAIFAIVCFAAMIGIGIWAISDSSVTTYQLLISEAVIFIFFLLGAIGYIITAYDFIILKENEVIVQKPFKKLTSVSCSQIKYFSQSPVVFDGITCYDEYGIGLFAVANMHVGVDKLSEWLNKKQIEQLPVRFPLKRFEGQERFELNKKSKKYKMNFGIFLGFAIAAFFLVFLIYPQLNYTPFENYKADGIISYCEKDESTITIALQDDESVYWLSNVIYPALDENFCNIMDEGVEVSLTVGYVDENDRKIISGIVSGDTQYLSPAEAEHLEYNNYHGGLIICYIFIAVGAVLIVVSAVYFYKSKKSERAMVNVDEEL